MNALASNGAPTPSDSFHAHLVLGEGANAHVSASSMDVLQAIVAKLQGAANDARNPAPVPAVKPAAKGAAPSPTPAPSTAPAAAPPAADATARNPTYDDVKARVLALAKVGREVATGALGKFDVDHANKLPLEQYSAFITHADELLAKK